ncbi:MAG: sodium-dependent transporter [Eubacterium sp.]
MAGREKFASRLGFILVSAGCAVGIGNVWKFPYICGIYGGAAFIVMYLVFLLILGLPILVCEFTVGRGSRLGMGKAFEQLEPKGTKWHHLKWISILGSFLLMMFYTMVGGWMMYYAYLEITGKMAGLDNTAVANVFSDMLSAPETMGLWASIAIVISFGICAFGVKNGVEKVTKVMMGFLIVLMMALAVHSFILPNASEGIKFYLVPDFKSVVQNGLGTAVFAAMSHAFFTLSIGIGAMEIFGSYLDRKKKITGEAINIILLDTFVALMAGFIIIPACFSFGVEPNSGPSLLFITLPNLFNNMAGGRIWGAMFFIFMSFAALSTIVAVFENIIAMFMDMNGWSRKKSVAVNFVLITVLSAPAILGFNLLSKFQPLGSGTSVMDLEDFLVSYNLLPLGSLVFVLFCVRKNGWGFENFLKEANKGSGMEFPKWIRVYMQYILPVIVTVIYLKGYYDYFIPQGKAVTAGWMCFAALLLLLIFGISLFTGRKKIHSDKKEA